MADSERPYEKGVDKMAYWVTHGKKSVKVSKAVFEKIGKIGKR